jgi:two-component system chemotaxis sensor kinase CheA
MSEVTNDPELLAGFFDETRESLEKVAALFVELERNPKDLQIIESIFRPVHSLKGNSSFFGFMGIKRLAHDMETILDYLRKGKLTVTPIIITTLLAGLDGLNAMVERMVTGGQEVDDPAALDALIERQRAVVADSTDGEQGSLPSAIGIIESWLSKSPINLDPLVTSAVSLLLNKVRFDLGIKAPTAQPQPQTTGLHPVLGELRALLEKSLQTELDSAAVERMGKLVADLGTVASKDNEKMLCAELLDAWSSCIGAAGLNDIMRDFVTQQVDILVTLPSFISAPNTDKIVEEKAVSPTSSPASEMKNDHPADGPRRTEAKVEAKSVRVPEARIDMFLRYVGELLVVGDMFNHLQTRVRALGNTGLLARDFRRVNDTFAQLSTKLQVAIMSIRKVPLRPHLAKVPRIVRDVAVAKGKEITVEIHGEEVEVDKSLVELIDAPLTHMSRNAADHGVETPEKRLALGKPREGRVLIKIEETSRAVVLTISDDGAGLNLERIRAKGESLGLVKPGVEMTEKDLINLIFASGLSTADTVSDVSGRGVGMDVVKRMIDEAGGTIQITTKANQGTEFRLTLPKGVTTQIVAAFLVRAGDSLVALPLERVRETFLRRGSTINNVLGGDQGVTGGQLLVRHDEALTLLTLTDILGIPTSVENGTIVTIDSNNRRLALAVSEVVGVRKIVVRPLDGLPSANGLYLGGAMMGDGAVALIINPDALTGMEAIHA